MSILQVMSLTQVSFKMSKNFIRFLNHRLIKTNLFSEKYNTTSGQVRVNILFSFIINASYTIYYFDPF